MSILLTLLLVLALFIVPFVIGAYLAQSLRMPDYGWKIGLILFTILASVALIYNRWPPQFGIDLSGGVILIYEIDKSQENPEDPFTQEKMGQLIDALKLRVNPGGQKVVSIRQYAYDEVEIIIPERSEAEAKRVSEIVSQTGALAFRILANDRDHKAQIAQAKAEPNKSEWRDSQGNLTAWFVPIRPGEEESVVSGEILRRQRKKGDKTFTEVLVVDDDYDVTGKYLRYARSGVDKDLTPCVNFVFNSKGGQLFGRLTGANLPDKVQTGFRRKLGIILDGELYSAPYLNSTIYEEGQITAGNFTQKEVDRLVEVLNAGVLPATLSKEPVQHMVSGATLGDDTIEKSLDAMIISSILVPLFMLVYYRFSGIIAIFALALNILVLLAIMLGIHAAFTLPGLAGVALTVGMAVDNNVLIYERLREELAKGAALRMAIRNAFQRASTTIFDANLTTLFVAVVLYVIGTDQIKGFAVTLFIGVAISLYTAVFVSRVIFDIAERHRWITQLKMLRILGHTNINFMRIFAPCAVISAVVILFGLGLSADRRKGLFDIDFTGGVSVQILFNNPQDINQVRLALTNEKHMPDLAVSDIQIGEEQRFRRFIINTSNSDLDDVEHLIQQEFGDKLLTNHVEVSPPKAIGAQAPPTPETTPAANLPPAPPATEKKPEAESPAVAPVETAPDAKTPRPAEEETSVPEAKPAEGEKQSHFQSLPSTLFALGSGGPLLLGQVTFPEETSPPPPPPPATKPQDTPQPRAPPAEKLQEKSPLPKTEELPPINAKAEEKPPAETPPGATTPPPPSLAELTDPFRGGSSFTLDFEIPVEYPQVEDYLKKALKAAKFIPENVGMDIRNPQYVEGDNIPYSRWNVKLSLPPEQAEAVREKMEKLVAAAPFYPASNKIGSAVAVSTRYQAVYALIASWVLIIIYLWVRFQGVAFGVAAVIALVHDVLVVLAAVAASYWIAQIPAVGNLLMIEQFKINLPMVAAFLTVIGYSANDTIVIFDRIREIRGKDPNMTTTMINNGVNQTLSRSIITSATSLIVVLLLYSVGGQALRGFSFALIVGIISGSYSSIYIASPILLWLTGRSGPAPAPQKVPNERVTPFPSPTRKKNR